MYHKLHIALATIFLVVIGALVWNGNSGTSGVSFGTEQRSPAVSSLEDAGIAPETPENIACATITIKVEGGLYRPCVTEDSTVLHAMQAAARDEGLEFVGKDYSSLGLYIDSINDKKAEGGYYWFLYINGTSSTRGISSALVHPGDVIEWRYKLGY